MRKIQFAVLLIITASTLLYSQESELQIGGFYQFITDVKIEEYVTDSEPIGVAGSQVKYKRSYSVTIVKFKDDAVIYRFLPFEDTVLRVQYNNGKLFILDKDEFRSSTRRIYNQYKGASMGAYTVPIRIRDLGGQNFDFESSLSLTANLVFRWGSRYKDYSWLDVSVGIGISSIDLTPENSLVTENRTTSALTYSLGVVFKPSSNTSVGIFTGADHLGLADNSVNWVYDGQVWLGIGIGINFTDLQSSSDPKRLTNP